MVALPIAGGCHCGALRYEVSQPPVMIYNCHCTNCQKISGGPFSTPATIFEAALVFTKGEPARVEWKADSGTVRFGLFCAACGGRIANGQTPTNGMLSLRSGTFDDASWVEPVGDIWIRSAQAWVTLPENRLRAEQQPADYAPFLERYRAQKRFGE